MLCFNCSEKWLKVFRWDNMNHSLERLFTFVIDLPPSYVPFSHPGDRWGCSVQEAVLRFPLQQWTWINTPCGDPSSRRPGRSCKPWAWGRRRRGLAKCWRGRAAPWTAASACQCLTCCRWRLSWKKKRKKKRLTRALRCCRAAPPRAFPGPWCPWRAGTRRWRRWERTGCGRPSRTHGWRWQSPPQKLWAFTWHPQERLWAAPCPRGRGNPARISWTCCRDRAWAARGQRWVLEQQRGSWPPPGGSLCFSLILWVIKGRRIQARPGWTGLWAAWCGRRCPARGMRWALRSFPTWTVLWGAGSVQGMNEQYK